MADAGHVAWDMASYEFLLQEKQFDSIHPSRQPQALLNRADGLQFTRNPLTPDSGEKSVIEVSNGTMTSIEGAESKAPDLTITVHRTDFEQVMADKATFDDLIAAGEATFAGNRKPFDQAWTRLVKITPDFEMVPGTRPVTPSAAPVPVELLVQPGGTDGSGG